MWLAVLGLALHDGISWDRLIDVAELAILMAVGTSALMLAYGARRPRQTYYLLATLSGLTAWLFVGHPALGGAVSLIRIMAWAGVTALGLVWCIYYERTEPLP